VLANVPDPVLLVGPDGLVREANAAARALLPTLRLGQPLSFGLRAPDILEAVAAASGVSAHAEYRERGPAERTFAVEITALSGPEGESPEVMLFFRDLTEARRLERMRVDFIANVSHELRTPLASVVGFIETLQGPARDDAAARERFLAIMQGQAWRMTRLIDDLLSLSRIELREHVAPAALVDLRSVAAQIIDTLGPMARDRGVEITLDAPGEPFTVLGDRDELLRVIENLVENAVKYGDSGGRVQVAILRRGGAIELSVRDYGPGIAHEHLPRLTERFYRVDVAESREKGGTGLGLAIVKHIVNRHRGRLAIASEPGQGATFTVSLPAAPAGRERRENA
jgi:two-component system phosphate regulon sensor histidine kinase PhoR